MHWGAADSMGSWMHRATASEKVRAPQVAVAPPQAEARTGPLLQRVAAGDARAFAELVVPHENDLRRLVSGLMADRHAVDDVLQETYLIAYRKIGDLRDEASFRSWMFRIGVREAFRARSRVRAWWKTLLGDETMDSLPHEQPDPLTSLAQRDEAQILLESIPGRERAALLLYAEGWTYEEICTILQRSMGTVSTWIRRARLRLQAQGAKDSKEKTP